MSPAARVAPPWTATLVLIPALNEAAKLPEVIAGVRRWAPGADVLVVDDGSSDRTGALARALGCEVVRHPFTLGHGAALQSGYRYAVDRGYAYVVQLDGDGQHDPAGIPAVLDPVVRGDADVVIGSRFAAGEGYPMSPLRRTTVQFFARVVRLLTGFGSTDPTSGFQALRRAVFAFHLGEHFPPDFPDADVLVISHRAGFRLAEVPVQMYPHHEGQSMHRGLVKIYYVFKQLVSLAIVVVSAQPDPPDVGPAATEPVEGALATGVSGGASAPRSA